MSPDRTTITRAEAIRRRKEEEQKQRDKLTQRNVSKPRTAPAPQPALKLHSTSAAKPAIKLRTGRTAQTNGPAATASPRWQGRYDIAMSAPRKQQARSYSLPKAPAFSISLPHVGPGPRWISLLIAILCLGALYLVLDTSMFIVQNADVTGNQRISAEEIQNTVGIANLPAIYLDPIAIENTILAAFSDVSSAQVNVSLPAKVVITLVERTPIAAWHQDGQTVWVDASGYAFKPRGQVGQLPEINAAGSPPAPAEADTSQQGSAKPFLDADLTNAINTLVPNIPQGAVMVYDPQYGLGWSDPRGWKVYFGLTNGDEALKLKVYQSMLDYLKQKNIQPTLISVEYPNAPYYRVEQ